jgi:hypothetical protein
MIFGRKQQTPEVGHDVLTSDEERLGDVTTVHNDYIDVTGGTLDRPITWRVPRSSIGKIDDEAIHLTLSRGQVMAQGWQQPTSAGDDSLSTIG